MALVLGLGVFLWGIGHILRLPVSARILMLSLLYVAVLAANIVLPDGHALRSALGGSSGEWLAVGAIGLLLWGYVRGLKYVRGFVRPENKSSASHPVSTAELERNARHIVLREIGGPGQKRLKDAQVLVVGAGGLGSAALQYLSAAGVGTIGVIDYDTVENSNLQRQVIHTDDRIGMPKVFSAELAMKAQNPFVKIRPYNRKLTPEIAEELVGEYDIVLDGSDNSETRYLVNEAAVRAGIPLVSAAISQWEGQISVFSPERGGPCYACVFPTQPAEGLAPSCAEGGVLGPLPGVVGSMMAVETVKYLTGAGEPLLGRMLIYDALSGETRLIGVKRRTDCEVCRKRERSTGSSGQSPLG